MGFFTSGTILKFIIGFFQLDNAEIIATSPFQFFDLAMSAGIYTACIACSPLFIYHAYGFLKDGLNEREKRFFFILLPISAALFLIGFSYSFAILYLTLNSIATFTESLGIQNLWDVSKFLLQIIFTSALLGLIFQFPIVLTFLTRTGIITPIFLKEKRRHAIAGMFILTALLPPTDGLSLLVMVAPLIVLYEMTIGVSFFLNRRKRMDFPARIEREMN